MNLNIMIIFRALLFLLIQLSIWLLIPLFFVYWLFLEQHESKEDSDGYKSTYVWYPIYIKKYKRWVWNEIVWRKTCSFGSSPETYSEWFEYKKKIDD